MAFIANQGVAPKGERYDRSALVNDETGKKYKRTEFGDFIYSSNNLETGSIGLNKYGNACISPVYSIFKPTGKAELDFLGRRFLRKDFINEMVRWRQGVVYGQWKIHETDFMKIEVKIPSVDEQKKIGQYLDSLDHLITLHQRILRKIVENQAFAWEQRKFADFTWDAGKRNKEDLDLESYAITNEHGFIRQCDAHDDFGYMKDTDRKAYNIVQPNSFAYNPARINVGSIGYYKGVENVIVSSLYEVFQTDKCVNDRFLWHWFKSDDFPRWIERLQEGSVRLYFYYDKLCECQLYMPSLEEQEKIASFLEALDHLITLHHRKRVKKQKDVINDWEQRKLGDILISLQNNTLSRADLSHEAGVAKNVHYGDVLIKFGEVLDVSKEKLPMISDEIFLSKYKEAFLQNGDVIVADTAEDSTVGKCSEIAGLNDEVVLSGLHTIPYRPIEKFASGYLGYYLNSSAYHNQLIPLMQGIKVTSISKSAMRDTDIVYPKSVEEQGKIGDYFQLFDHLITLHHRKRVKKQKDVINDWEQRKLKELGEIMTGSTPSTSKSEYYSEDGIPWVTPTDINSQTISDTPRKLSEEGIKVGRVVPANTILCTCIASIGKNTLLTVKGSFNQQINCLTPNEYNDAYFLLTESEIWSNIMKRMAAAGTMQIVNKTEFSELTTMVPKLEEQKKIGQYFLTIDHLITLHQHKQKYLKNIKYIYKLR